MPSRRPVKRKAPAVALLGALCAIALPALIFALHGSPALRLRGPTSSRRKVGNSAMRWVGSTDPARRIQVGLALRLRSADLARNLRAQQTRGNPLFGHHLTAVEFGRRFGLSDGQLMTLKTRLGQLGLQVDRTYPQRTAVVVEASVARISRVFSIRFGDYLDSARRRHYSAEGAAEIPSSLAPYVTGVGGLSNLPPQPLDIPATGLTRQLVGSAYDIAPLWSEGIQGQGQTIAVVSLGTFSQGDIEAFDQKDGISSAPAIQRVPVDGGTNDVGPQGAASEVAMDLEVVRGIAPQATILNYEAGGNKNLDPSLADVYNQIVADGRATVVTTSYGICEANAGLQQGDERLVDAALAAAQARGITVLAASGDTGAYACLQTDPTDPNLGVQTPASSAGLISVGGTRLSVRKDGSYLDEQAWSAPFERAGGGGGIAVGEPRPSWQAGPGVLKQGVNANGFRQVPDVAGPADPNAGFLICYAAANPGGPPCSPGNGGTSAAAPFWAASLLLVQQYAQQHRGGNSRFAAPILYSLAASKQTVPPFHDITHGNNGYYDATSGWDYATGLGSPDVFNLAQDYTTYVRKSR